MFKKTLSKRQMQNTINCFFVKAKIKKVELNTIDLQKPL